MTSSDHTSPHWENAGLVVIDMQVDFADGGASPIPGTTEVTPNVVRLTDAFRRADQPIVHIVRLYPPGSSDVDLPRRALVESGATIVAPGSPGSAIITGLASPPVTLDAALLLAGRPQTLGTNEIALFKPRWGAFYRTSLETWLRDRQVDTVVVAGCNLPNCPRATLFEASERDFRTVLVEDAVSQSSPERLADLSRIGVTLMSTARLVDRLLVRI